MQPVSFASIGECMLELSARKDDLWHMGIAGDTFNAAWYARKILPKDNAVAYVTALGDDPFSQRILRFIDGAAIATDRIRRVEGRRPGLYAITLDGAERTFTYWRGESAARLLADDADWLKQAVSGAELLYFSGITLGILQPEARERLLAALADQRRQGARIAFDPNFRTALWQDRDQARAVMEAAYATADVVLPTFDDEAMLFGDPSVEATAERIARSGAAEIVVKNGSGPCVVIAEGRRETVPPVKPERVVDTTGAGDSFGGAYLAGRLTGMTAPAAARLGHLVAAEVIGVHGALAEIDGNAMLQKAEAERGA